MEKKKDSKKPTRTIEKLNSISTIVTMLLSVIIGVTQIHLAIQSNELNERYNHLTSYSQALSYALDISKTEGHFSFDGVEVTGGNIFVIPRVGGISKVYAVHYYKDNVKAIVPVELYSSGLEKSIDAQDQSYRLSDYTIDDIAFSSGSGSHFGTLYLLVQDYSGKWQSNMLVFEVNKTNQSDWACRQYGPIDILHCDNDSITTIPEFDLSQLDEYRSLLEKLDRLPL